MFDKVKDALTRKFGPQPAWAWLSELAGGLYLYRKHQAAQAATTAAATSADTGGQDTSGYDQYYQPYGTSVGAAGDSGGGGDSGDNTDSGTTGTPVVYDPLTDSYLSDIDSELAALARSAGGGGGGTTTTTKTTATTTGVGTVARPRKPVPLTSGSAAQGDKSIVTLANGKSVAASSVPAGWTAVAVGSGILNIAYAVPSDATNVKVNKKTGVITYTAADGSSIEQAPGKPRYVTSKAPAPVTTSKTTESRSTPTTTPAAPAAKARTPAVVAQTTKSAPAPAPAPLPSQKTVVVVGGTATPKAQPGVRLVE